MFCSKCKNPIGENARFCEWCGASCANKETNSTFRINININNSNYKFEQSSDKEFLYDFLPTYPTQYELKVALESYCRKTGLDKASARKEISNLWHENYPAVSLERKDKINIQMIKFPFILLLILVLANIFFTVAFSLNESTMTTLCVFAYLAILPFGLIILQKKKKNIFL